MRDPHAVRLARMVSIALLASGLALAGCGGDDDGHDPAWLARRASEVRELDFREDVELVRLTREEFQAQADEPDEAELRELAETYGRLGFFPIDADLRPILTSSSDWVGATYSADAKVITLVEDDRGDVPASTQVHEYVHALQDQHFDLSAFDEGASTSDEYLARRAVVEGDAVLAEARFVAQDEHDVELDAWNWPELLSYYQGWGAELLADSTYALFSDYPSFAYPFGLEYTATNLLGPDFAASPPHDWSREDELFTERPPPTTKQVVLMSFEADPVELVGLDSVPPMFEGRLEAVDWDTLGVWYVYLLFYDIRFSFGSAGEVAPGWRGDRVLFVRDLERDGAIATVWASAWETSGDAFRAAGALDSLYERTPFEDSLYGGTAADGEPVWIEDRLERVVAIKNLDPQLAEAMAYLALQPPAAPRARRARPPLRQRLRQLVH